MLDRKVFIHIPKNAGMTIRRSPVLRDRIIICGQANHKSPEYSQRVLETMNKHGDHHGFEHARWRDVKPGVTRGHDCFAIIRNPWDRVVSRYFFAKKVIEVEQKQPASYADVSSFEAFLEERHKWGGVKYMWHRAVRGWYTQFDHVTDKQGKVQCDLLRLEDLDNDLKKYFKILKMSEPRNVTAMNKGSYQDIYTKETIQIVADWYKDDIDYFGFDFDTAAQKNYWSAQ